MHRLLLPLALAAAVIATPASAVEFEVAIDTTPLAGTSGWLAFDLVAGDVAGDSSVSISSFVTTGALGRTQTAGSVSGSLLAPPLLLSSSSFFSEFLQALTFGSGVTRFRIDVPAVDAGSAIPDAFALFLLDSSLAPYATADPTGADALLVIDLDAAPTPVPYTSAFATISVVPEPPVWWLLAGGAALLYRRSRT